MAEDPTGGKGRGPRLHTKLKSYRYLTGFSDVSRELGEGYLRINDLIFQTPPTSIKITGHDVNHEWDTLRTKGSMKARSGHGTLVMNISLVFARDSLRRHSAERVINTNLLPLIREFKKTPFCQIENELIRRSVPVGPEDAITAALVGMSVQVMAGAPEAIQADLQLLWFNHKPFTPKFTYRKDWTNEDIDRERREYDSMGDIAYRRERGRPSRVYNSLAQMQTGTFVRSAPAMLHFRDDLMDLGTDGYRQDDITVGPTSVYERIRFDGNFTFKFWDIKVPTVVPPGAIEKILKDEDIADRTSIPEVYGKETEGGGARPYIKRFKSGGRKFKATAGTVEAWERMRQAAKSDGIDLFVVSAQRSNSRQEKNWRKALKKYGDWKVARKYVAPPMGWKLPNGKVAKGSKHLQGIALDILWSGRSGGTKSEDVEKLKNDRGFQWLARNAGRFGFKNYKAEPWHWNFTGRESRYMPAQIASKKEQKKLPKGGVPADLYRKIQRHARNHGIPLPLALGLVSVESNFNPRAESRASKNNALTAGQPGARGLTQVLWKYHKAKDLFDPDVNLDTGFGMLKGFIKKYGNYGHALMAYNWGPGNLDKALDGKKNIPTKTKGYAEKIAKNAAERFNGAQVAAEIRGLTPVEYPEPPPADQLDAGETPTVDTSKAIVKLRKIRDSILADVKQDLLNGTQSDKEMLARVMALDLSPAGHLATEGNSHDFDRINQDLSKTYLRGFSLWREREAPVSEGWRLFTDPNTKKKLFQREHLMVIPKDLQSVTVTHMAFVLSNSVAPLPIIGHRYPTLQYLGSMSPKVDVTMAFKGEEGREKLELILAHMQRYADLAIGFREFHKALSIEVQNDLLNAVGIRRVLLEDWQVKTLPEMKDTVMVTFRFVDNSVDMADSFSVPRASGQTLAGKRAIKLLLERAGFKTYTDASIRNTFADSEEWHDDRRNSAWGYENGFVGKYLRFSRVVAGNLLATGHIEEGSENMKSLVRDMFDTSNPFESDNKVNRTRSIAGVFLDTPGHLYRNFKRTKVLEDPVLENLAAKLQDLLNKHGSEIDDYPNRYGLDEYFSANNESDFKWIDSPGKKHPGINSGQEGTLTDFENSMEVLVKRNLLQYALTTSDKELAAAAGDMYAAQRIEAKPCYPDLDLPPNPITGKISDTNPDFYFWNWSDVMHGDSPTGQQIKSLKATYKRAGRQALVNSYNSFLNEQIGPPEKTLLRDPSTYPDRGGGPPAGADEESLGAPVTNRPPRTKTGTFSDRKILASKAGNYNHYAEIGPDQILPEGDSLVSQDLTLDGSISLFEDYIDRHWVEDKLTMRRAYPTFKVFFIEEDQPDREWKVFDDFYGINSIKEIRIVRSRKIAADTCLIQLTNISGTLTNRNFPGFGKGVDTSSGQPRSTHESIIDQSPTAENPFQSTMLKEGTKIQVRLGYSNDYDELETVFNGQIVGVEGNELLNLICQSYATELVAVEKGDDPNEPFGTWHDDTDEILSTLIAEPECKHFGRWTIDDVGLPLYTRLRPDGQTHLKWGMINSPSDDNIFCEDWDQVKRGWGILGIRQLIDYVAFHTTIWDVFKEMELRHPGWIASPVPYGDRMTMFFGLPHQKYLWRPPKSNEEARRRQLFERGILRSAVRLAKNANIGKDGHLEMNHTLNQSEMEQLIQYIDDTSVATTVANGIGQAYLTTVHKGFNLLTVGFVDGPGTIGDTLLQAGGEITAGVTAAADLGALREAAKSGLLQKLATETGSEDATFAEIALRDQIKPFRNYHFVTSEHDIIANNIIADHRGTFNAITVDYNDYDIDDHGVEGRPTQGSRRVALDGNIHKNHIRHIYVPEPNCPGEYFAGRYGISHLARSLKDTYKGTLTILGDPRIKPYDVVYLYDNYTDMSGPIEVEQVVHTLSKETGFITEITPDLCVNIRRAATLGVLDAAEVMATGAFMSLIGKDSSPGPPTGAGQYAGGALAAAGIGVTAAGAAATKTAVAGTLEGAAAAGQAGATAFAAALPSVGAVGTAAEAAALQTAATQVGGRAAAAGVAAVSWPVLLTLGAAILGVAAGGYKFLRFASTLEPVAISPLIRSGKPYVSGFNGFEMDGLVLSIKKEWSHFIDDLDRGTAILDLKAKVLWDALWDSEL